MLQILYESATVIHGRPYPLVGYSYSNVFLHFEPVGFSERHYNGAGMQERKDPKSMFEEALADHQKAANSPTPRRKQKAQPRPYYVPAIDDDRWNQRYVYVKKASTKKPKIEIKMTKQLASEDRLFHNLAAKGELPRMKEMVVSTHSSQVRW